MVLGPLGEGCRDGVEPDGGAARVVTMGRTISDDVRLLGDTLGHVLCALAGDELFQHVEGMRLAAKRARDDTAPDDADRARDELAQRAAALDPAQALDVVRAFTLYFQLVNLAEDVHRARELRRRELEGGPAAVAESLAAVLSSAAANGTSRDQALEALADVELRFVFTAHPTEARRRTTERLLAGARASLERRDREALTPRQHAGEDRRLRAAVEALWQHGAERTKRPEVLDEVKAGLWYLEHVLLEQVPQAQRSLHHAFEASFGPIEPSELPLPWRFGSWMGSDRDGNPYVDDAVTERALGLQRRIVLRRYDADLAALADHLAAVRTRLPPSPILDRALARAEAAVPEVARQIDARNLDEPLRRLLAYARERLLRTARFDAGAYPSCEALLEDVEVMRSVLIESGASALPSDALLELEWRIRCFGFSLAALDVREDAAVHRAVVGELLMDPSYAQADDVARRARLASLALPGRGVEVSETARRLLDLFANLARWQARFGPEAIGTYIISMTQSAADVLEVLAFARLHRVDRDLDIVPLLETPEDLENAGPLLETLFSDASYRQHLRGRGDVQELLVGYSDSMKSGGVVSSRTKVFAAQRAAASVCRRHGVLLRVFHGRGGSVSRGGGPTYRAIGALPRDAFSGRVKITEQGEMRALNFADPHLAERYLEQTGGAAWIARLEALGETERSETRAERDRDQRLIERLADVSQRAYRALVEDPDLVIYFREATPLSAIAALTIASRPSKRRDAAMGLADLRAIPWVFAWSQSRHGLTGWYGVGSALETVAREEGLLPLRELHRRSAFFRDLIENVAMSLAKSDLPIARRYAELCEDPERGRRIFERIREEHERTVRWLLQVHEKKALLDDDPVLQRSIRLRNPYVDPLSYLQVVALRRAREETPDRPRWESVTRAAVQGIAAGLRHTG